MPDYDTKGRLNLVLNNVGLHGLLLEDIRELTDQGGEFGFLQGTAAHQEGQPGTLFVQMPPPVPEGAVHFQKL